MEKFKIQISQASNDDKRYILYYNQKRTIIKEQIATPEQIIFMGKAAKRYIEGELKNGELVVQREIPPQNW